MNPVISRFAMADSGTGFISSVNPSRYQSAIGRQQVISQSVELATGSESEHFGFKGERYASHRCGNSLPRAAVFCVFR